LFGICLKVLTISDAMFIETPDNKKILIDIGEEKLLARYVSKKFYKRNSKETPLVLDAVVITHGDVDHYKGLIELINCRDEFRPKKKLYCRIDRLYHNGLMKRSFTLNNKRRKEIEKFGDTIYENNKLFVTDLLDNFIITNYSKSDFSHTFKTLIKTLNTLNDVHPINCERIDTQKTQAFDFVDNDIHIDILNPETYTLSNNQKGLPFLHSTGSKSLSSSHTINGHSIVLRMTYGNVRFLFCADINTETEKKLLDEEMVGEIDLTTEIFKVPHHGSSDYDIEFLKKIKPVISILSCGDGNETKDYMHPRANLLAALGKYTRGDEPVIFSTEICSFFKYRGPALPAKRIKEDNEYKYYPKKGGKHFFAHEKKQPGIIHIRTDGKKVLAVRHSSNEGIKESYLYEISQEIKSMNNKIDIL